MDPDWSDLDPGWSDPDSTLKLKKMIWTRYDGIVTPNSLIFNDINY